MPLKNFTFVVLIAIVFIATTSRPLQGQSASSPSQGGDDVRTKTQNPVSSMYSLPLKSTWDFGAPDGTAYFLNVQPVIPVTVGDWNLVNRVIVPIIDVPGFISGTPDIPSGVRSGGATGLGDINYSLFFSPADAGKVIWGVGPSISFPSATDDSLGTGKWSAGPTAVLLTQPKPWSVGVLVRQLWSFAGQSNRRSVSQFLLEPFVNYNLPQGWYLITDPILTANWNADSGNMWTVPLGGGFGKIFEIGNQMMNSKLEAYANVVKPDGGPDWSLSFTIQFLFPR